ncbi:MAG TPA: Rpn family recombination-promoting nuclease/putative transposase [Pedobacter sp.]|uniref:Rpn family recombination-promoting nuclease/putative transposase n=1 Tax=Pedobacter sp. TaxID=1411316 RepID=UPI002CD37B95|nr:Rpn family recombination-promoting nuclease/putative transposase [Pedobacter sp.]HMI03092.1 Rpn family recombination-promoting nuclease/putative transposase [Pedobacter sp.]
MPNRPKPTTFIDPFVDWSFKRLFASEESKPILIGLLNQIFKGRKYITAIEYGKNEHPGENAKERGVVFDVTCTDADGSKFIIEVQRASQEFFIDRALYYASKAISEQALKVKGKKWNYKLKEVYVISFLENFRLPNSLPSAYVHDICLTNRYTGKIFYDKMGLIFVEMLSFVKSPVELETDLDRWLYALKHLTEFKERPPYLNGSEFDPLFDLAKYANLNKEERNMYNDSLKHKWDNENVMDYAIKTAKQEGRAEERAKAQQELDKKNHDFVANLLTQFNCSDEQAASAAEVTISFVKKVRKELSAKK